MSQTLAQTLVRVRILLKDPNPPAGGTVLAVTDVDAYHTLMDLAQIMAPDLGLGRGWVSAWIAISDTESSDFSPAVGIEYETILELVRASDHWPLERVSNTEMEMLRRGTMIPFGPKVTHYTILEKTSGANEVVTIRVHPRPTAADSLDALLEEIPTAAYADATVLPFSHDALRGLEREAAIDLALGMLAEDFDDHGLSKDLLARWEREAAASRQNASNRRRRQRRAPRGMTVRRGW